MKDAKRFIEKYKRVDIAIDAYYNDPTALAMSARRQTESVPSTSKLNALFDKYKGTIILSLMLTTRSLMTLNLLAK